MYVQNYGRYESVYWPSQPLYSRAGTGGEEGAGGGGSSGAHSRSRSGRRRFGGLFTMLLILAVA